MKLDLGTALLKLCEKFCIYELTVRSELNNNFEFDEKYKTIKNKCSEIKKRSPIYKSSNSYSGEGKIVPDSINHYQQNFHWCESPANSSSVVYFTLSQWHEFQKASASYYINRGIFSGPISTERIKEIKNYNVGTARCLVKSLETRDYRLISNLKTKQSHLTKYSRKKSKIVDFKSLKLLELFKSLKLKKPELITDDLYAPDSYEEIRKYRDRMNSVKQNKFYIVRADMKNCYESLRHQDLRSIFSDLISKTKDPEIKSKKFSLKSEFYDFLENIYVKFGSNYYHQICGIPQGSQLSSYLCGIYMLHIKRKAFSDFSTKDNALLLQYVDDVLFISLSQTEAECFLKRLLTVYPKYGLELNNSKIICSWKNPESPSVIPWLGYNLNDSCEVTLKVNNQLKTLSRFAGFPQNAQKSLNYLKLKLSYAFKRRAIIANSIHDNCCSEEIINYNCELLGRLSAYIFLCRVRACLEPHELLSGTSSQKIAGLLKAFLFNYIENYKLYEVALKSLKKTLLPYKGQMKWILHYLCKLSS
uniref:Telomerase reverse transcriptase n=1 Tax=Schmidtea mediterranea TaxID=79327 RepID=G1BJ47_SCHMD|nr:telomerase reverse transcriptase subunit isoform 2 [Schmidtea mediterranea]